MLRVQRKSPVDPGIQTPGQQADLCNAVAFELKCHTGTGRFVGSCTEQNDFPVFRDFVIPVRKF
jgi:hypothetical protein